MQFDWCIGTAISRSLTGFGVKLDKLWLQDASLLCQYFCLHKLTGDHAAIIEPRGCVEQIYRDGANLFFNCNLSMKWRGCWIIKAGLLSQFFTLAKIEENSSVIFYSQMFSFSTKNYTHSLFSEFGKIVVSIHFLEAFRTFRSCYHYSSLHLSLSPWLSQSINLSLSQSLSVWLSIYLPRWLSRSFCLTFSLSFSSSPLSLIP